MKIKILGLSVFLLLSINSLYAGITWNAFMEGGFQWYNSANTTIVTNGIWAVLPYQDNRYGYYELKMNLLSDNGWNGWGNLQMNILDSAVNLMQLKNGSIHFSYRPNKLNFSLIRNENWTWLGQPYLSIFGQKNTDIKTVTLFFENTDAILKGLHNKVVVYAKDVNNNYFGTRFDGPYKIGKIISGSWGATFAIKRWKAVSNNTVNALAADVNANIILPNSINVFLGLEVARMDEPWRGALSNTFFIGAIQGWAYRLEAKASLPTAGGNFGLNTYFLYQGKNFDANDQLAGTGANWFEEFFQFTYAFPLKMIDFEFNVKYGHPVYVASGKLGDPNNPTSTVSQTDWIWGYHFWEYNEAVFGTGQVLQYFAKLNIQFKKGVKFYTSYTVFKPGSIELWGSDSSKKYDDAHDNDALFFELRFENETGKINVQYKIFRPFYEDPIYRIDVAGLELVVNISSQLKLYSRILLMNSGGKVLSSSGSTTWWNYFGQIQYYPVNNLGIYLEFGNGGDSDKMTSSEGATRSAKEFERKIVLKFNYNI